MMMSHSLRLGFLMAATGAVFSALPAQGVVFKSRDDNVQIKLPDSWKEAQLPPGSSETIELFAVNEKAGATVTVAVEEESDKVKTIDDYMQASIDALTKKYGDLTHTEVKPTKVNGNDALRCEMKFTAEGHKMGYIITVMKVDTHFEMVGGMAIAERFTTLKPSLMKLADGVSDITGAAGAQVVAKGRDGTIQLTLPGGWSQQPLPVNSPAAMQLSGTNFKQGLGVQVVSVSRADTTKSLKDELTITLDALKREYPDLTRTEPESVKVAGYDALRCEATFSTRESKIAYLITEVQTPGNFHQIDAFCEASKLDKHRAALLKLADGMKEMTPAPETEDTPVIGKGAVLKGKDGTVQITLPRSWKAADAPPGADKSLQISAINSKDDVELLVIVEPREKSSLSLKDYTSKAVESFMRSGGITNASHTEPQAIKVGNQDAMQFEFHGIASGTKLAYLVTIIQTDKNFLRSEFFSTETKFAKAKPSLNAYLEQLKETKPGDDQ